MKISRAVLKITAGPNKGDTLSVDLGACRLVGRHLSDSETALIDRSGNRVLDGAATSILSRHLKDRTPPVAGQVDDFSVSAFERGADIIFADDAISRAHAMVFFDTSGVGIIDLASTNGTFVNEQRITSQLVQDGDSITLGSSSFTVQLR